jgi:hypothetical protein
MEFKEFEKAIKKIKKNKRIKQNTEVYIDVYECLAFMVRENEKYLGDLVLDVNENELFDRGLK